LERIERNLRDIDQVDRHVLEHVVGQALRDNQRLIIQIAEVDLAHEIPTTDAQPPQTLADWTKVYEGLSDEQVEAVDKTIKTRANLTRNLP
jgi:ribosomal silencing factor RsfS